MKSERRTCNTVARWLRIWIAALMAVALFPVITEAALHHEASCFAQTHGPLNTEQFYGTAAHFFNKYETGSARTTVERQVNQLRAEVERYNNLVWDMSSRAAA